MKLKKYALMFFVPIGFAITGISILSSSSRVIRAEDVMQVKLAAWLRYDVVQLFDTNYPALPTTSIYGYDYVSLPEIGTNLIGNGTILLSDLESAAFRAGWMASNMKPSGHSISWLSSSSASKILNEETIIDIVGSYTEMNDEFGTEWVFKGSGSEKIPGYGSRKASTNNFRGFPCISTTYHDVYGSNLFTNASLAVAIFGREEGFPYAISPESPVATNIFWPSEAGNIAYCCSNLTVIGPTGGVRHLSAIKKSTLSQIQCALTNVEYTFCRLYSTNYLEFNREYKESGRLTNNVCSPPFTGHDSTYRTNFTYDQSGILRASAGYSVNAIMGENYDTSVTKGGEWDQSVGISYPKSFSLEYPSVWAVTNGLVKSITVLGIPTLNLSGMELPPARQGEKYLSDDSLVTYSFVELFRPSDIVSLLTGPAASWFVLPSDGSVPASFTYDQACTISNAFGFSVNGCRARVLSTITDPEKPEDLAVNLTESDYSYPEKWVAVDHMMYAFHTKDDSGFSHHTKDDFGSSQKIRVLNLSYSIDEGLYVLVQWVNPFEWIKSHASKDGSP